MLAKKNRKKHATTETISMSIVPTVPELDAGEEYKNTPAFQESPSLNWSWRMNASWYSPEELIEILDPQCKAFAFQKERGEELTEANPQGYLHYQGCMTLKGKQRQTGILKWLRKGTELQKTKNLSASKVYCTKEDSRVEGPWIKEPELRKKAGAAGAEELRLVKPSKEWQLEIVEMIQQEPDVRSVFWYWEPDGGAGKTQFAKFVCATYGGLYANGKKADILYAASITTNKILIIDIERDEDKIPYSAMEAVKNGIFFAGKFKSTQVIRNSPHVIVFANRPPDRSRMSADRWKVKRIVVGPNILG